LRNVAPGRYGSARASLPTHGERKAARLQDRENQHSLYQVSTATALVEGVYQFVDLDGEMVIVDGCVFQVRFDG